MLLLNLFDEVFDKGDDSHLVFASSDIVVIHINY
jgi:hypothetical protein